ncbi:MAG: hypothetical protein AAF530_08145 [Pseudomonadota bacterium]
MRSSDTFWRSRQVFLGIAFCAFLMGGWSLYQGANAAGLSQTDRSEIEKFLGTGVVGKAVAEAPAVEGSTLFPEKGRTETFTFTGGDQKGKSQKETFEKIKKDEFGATGRLEQGEASIDYLTRDKDGNILVVAEQNTKKGIVSRFAPAEPAFIPGLSPGDSKSFKIDVKVYDLTDTKDVTHKGTLNVIYDYVGVYEVTVPAGSYQAALIKTTYQGEVGPASVKDTQYRFLAHGVGVVAMIEKKDISAMLVYHDHSKYGKVLEKVE